VWARWQHFFNLFFLPFVLRSGLQILADHSRPSRRQWLRRYRHW